MSFANADLNAIHLSTITTTHPPVDISHLSSLEQDHYRIRRALDTDMALHAMVFYDIQRHDSMIFQGPPPVRAPPTVQWNDVVTVRAILPDDSVLDTISTTLHPPTVPSHKLTQLLVCTSIPSSDHFLGKHTRSHENLMKRSQRKFNNKNR